MVMENLIDVVVLGDQGQVYVWERVGVWTAGYRDLERAVRSVIGRHLEL